MKAVSIKVTGKVQGVFYRQSTLEKARELGIKGFVKNMPDGSVYIEAEGPEADVNALVEWCKRGPKHAVVTKINVTELPFNGFTDFCIEQ
jgi:acylphosphatase